MTPEQFVYWLQGYFEIEEPESLDKVDIKKIQDHLNLVLKKVTPTRSFDWSDKIKENPIIFPEERFPKLCNQIIPPSFIC